MELGEVMDSPVHSPKQVDGAMSLPRNLLESQATVLLCKNQVQCGILEVVGMGRANVYCFFLAKDVLLAQDLRPGQKFSEWLPQGSRVKINAKLIRENAKAPYLATTVWAESEDNRVTEEMTNKVFRDIDSDVMQKYADVSSHLCWQLNKKDDDGIRLITEKEKSRKRDHGGTPQEVIRSPRTPPSPPRKHVAFQKDRSPPGARGGRSPRTPSPSRSRGRSPSPKRNKDRDNRKRNRSREDDRSRSSRNPSPKRRRPRSIERVESHIKWQPTDINIYKAGLQEEFDTAYGVKGMVVRYESGGAWGVKM